VKGLGLKYHKHHAYPDHYDFKDSICLEKILADPSEILLCTQKDLMKLALHQELAPRLAALVQDYHFAAAEEFKKRLLTVLSLKPNRAIT
ncbi:MAG: tetraacyldisaccharide 4'-kinase, partial [Candidatus Cloacimonetes bacterium]|nr:tetraacyldisaccharide 4'-kinase [Candidatus Cloacimonadota bacterium]